jgi:predicted KAP-like P-loop ATPase
VTWPAIGKEVDEADFVGLETLRVLRPDVYRALRANKEKLCGGGESMQRADRQPAEHDRLLLGSTKADDVTKMRRALMRLFPHLEAVWSNVHYSDSSQTWARQRRACSQEHFDTYFRFAIGDGTLPMSEIEAVIAHASDEQFVTAALRQALATVRADGSTKAALLLDELNVHAGKVADADVTPLLTAIFQLGDELNVPADASRGFSFANNNLRIHWLLRRLTLERFNLNRRSTCFMAACKTAALGWLIDFAESAYRGYHPREGKSPEPEEKCLTTLRDAERLHKLALTRIRAASRSDELGQNKELPYLLYRWREFAEDNDGEVKRWVIKQLKQDAMVVALARAFTSHSWSQGLGFAGLGDRVARRNTRASVGSLDTIMNKDKFRKRVEELAAKDTLAAPDANAIRTFLDAWIRHDKNPRD